MELRYVVVGTNDVKVTLMLLSDKNVWNSMRLKIKLNLMQCTCKSEPVGMFSCTTS